MLLRNGLVDREDAIDLVPTTLKLKINSAVQFNDEIQRLINSTEQFKEYCLSRLVGKHKRLGETI